MSAAVLENARRWLASVEAAEREGKLDAGVAFALIEPARELVEALASRACAPRSAYVAGALCQSVEALGEAMVGVAGRPESLLRAVVLGAEHLREVLAAEDREARGPA